MYAKHDGNGAFFTFLKLSSRLFCGSSETENHFSSNMIIDITNKRLYLVNLIAKSNVTNNTCSLFDTDLRF